MKELFASYYQLADEDFAKLWEEGVFILDANILLSAYRLPKGARGDLFKILESIKKRLWIPFQAALEFHENRLGRVAEQKSMFDKVQSAINNVSNAMATQLEKDLKDLQLEKRHSVINTKPFAEGLREKCKDFSETLNILNEEQPDVLDKDLILENISNILKGKIGTPPSSQDELDKMYDDGKRRFNIKMPPGYKDAGKEGQYFFKNMRFERKYGDLILWKQIIQEVKDNKHKYVVFITSDDKEDWWQEIRGKKIGPRRELIDELTSMTEVTLFHMYDLERFMFYSKKHLGITVNDDSLTQAKDVVALQQADETNVYALAHHAVLNWLMSTEGNLGVTDVGIDEFIVHKEDSSAYNVKVISIEQIPSLGMQTLMNYWAQGYKPQSGLSYDNMKIVVVARSNTLISEIINILGSRQQSSKCDLEIELGIVKYSAGMPCFDYKIGFTL